MTRKSDYAFWTFVMLACLAGATTLLNVTRTYSATSTNSEIYKQLDLFGDVLERVRSDYVDKPDDATLIDFGHQRHARRPRSPLGLPQPEELPRHAGADARRIRRARHRGDDGERRGQGGLAHRRHAGGQGRPADQRPHHPPRQRADRGPDARAGGRKDARARQHADHAHHRAQGQGRAVRREDRARRDPHQCGQGPRRRRHDLRQDLDLQRADACQPGEAGRRPEEDGQEPQGLRDRSQGQSRRPARPGDRRLRRLPRQGSDRAHQGPRSRGDAARQCAARRHHRRQADRRAHQRRLGLGLRDRGRRVAGPQARDRHRHALVRQGLGADHHSAGRQRRHPPDHGALLHAGGPLDPGQGHRSRCSGRAGAAAGAAVESLPDAQRVRFARSLEGRQRGQGRLGLVQLRAEGGGEGLAAAIRLQDAARRAAAAAAGAEARRARSPTRRYKAFSPSRSKSKGCQTLRV